MIYVLYGQPASGKTTLGKSLTEYLNTPFIIDGDEFRGMFKNEDYGYGGRKKNIRAANAVATYLTQANWLDQTPPSVVMSLVNPYKQFRNELKEDNEGQVVDVFLHSDRELKKEYHVEDFDIGEPNHIICTDKDTEESWEELKGLLRI